MFPKLRDPLLSGCRLLLWPQGRLHSNLAGRDPAPAVTGSPVGASAGVHPAITLDGSSYASYGAINSYGGTKDITIAFRAKNTATPGNGSACVVACARAGFPASHGFIVFMGNTPGSGENAWSWGVFAGGTTNKVSDTVAASAYLNKDVPVVVTYNSVTRTVTLYVDGMKRAANTDLGQDWDPWGDSSALVVGATEAGAVPWVGDLSYLIVWDRCLDDGEAAAVMRDHDWPFAKDDEMVGLFPLNATYVTSIGLAQATGVSGAVSYATVVDASASFTGDITSIPEPAGDVLYVTTIAVRSVGVGDTPEFGRYVTSVGVSQVYTPAAPVRYVTRVLISPHASAQLDGRKDLIETFRYRR